MAKLESCLLKLVSRHDFLVENSGSRKNLEVDFLWWRTTFELGRMQRTRRMEEELRKTHNKHFNFTLTTNGVLIDDVIRFNR